MWWFSGDIRAISGEYGLFSMQLGLKTPENA